MFLADLTFADQRCQVSPI